MLGTHGQKLCNNIDVHWLTPTTGGMYRLYACDSSTSAATSELDVGLGLQDIELISYVFKCFIL